MNDKAIIEFKVISKKLSVDLEIPLDISANDLVLALNSAYDLGIDTSDIKNCYFRAENPIALLRGSRTLKEFGIRNASVIYFIE